MIYVLYRRLRFGSCLLRFVPGWVDDLVVIVLLALIVLVPCEVRAADDDGQRVLGLLDAAAERARDRRILDGVGALATGTTLVGAGVASWATPSSPGARTARDVLGGVFVGVGSALTLGGVLGFAQPSSIERLRVLHGPALRAGGAQASTASMAIGVALAEGASAARTERQSSAIASFVAGAAMASGGIVLELEASDHGLVWLGRSLMVASAGTVAIGVGDLVVRSEEERLLDLFRQTQPASRQPAACGVCVVPRIGLGVIGLAGTF